MTLSSKENTNFYLGKDMGDGASAEQSGENVEFGCTEVADKVDKVDMVNFEVEQSSDMVDLVAGRLEEEENELAAKISEVEGNRGVIMQAGHLDKYREVKMEYREVKKKVAKTMDTW